MLLSLDEFLDIEARNEKRKALHAEVSKGRWVYDSFAWLEVESRPYKERSCIIVRRYSWFEKLWKKYGYGVLDEGTTEGNLKHALQPARDGLYLEVALNDHVEEDIRKLLSEIRQLRNDIPPPPEFPSPKKRPKKKRPKKGRALPPGSRKGDKPVYDTEWEFREWFEDNLDQFGFKRVILSQEPCPDYVLETASGEVLRVEAELFAANFVAHGHDPNKVDRIVACFSMDDQIAGVPVLSAINLREYNPEPVHTKQASEDLSGDERRVLGIIMSMGGIELSALAKYGFAGNLMIFRRVPPEMVGKLTKGRTQDSLFQVIGRETKAYIRKFQHVLLGSGLSDDLCKALDGLAMKELAALRPIPMIAALYDGVLVDHEGWVPTEVYATNDACLKFGVDVHGRLIKRGTRDV